MAEAKMRNHALAASMDIKVIKKKQLNNFKLADNLEVFKKRTQRTALERRSKQGSKLDDCNLDTASI